MGILVFAPVGWWYVAVVAWVPLILGVHGVKPSHGLYLGLLHGVIFFGVTLSWLFDVFEGSCRTFASLILMLSLFTGLFARGYAVASLRYGKGWVTAFFWRGVVGGGGVFQV